MSENAINKLRQFEVEPPLSAWENICTHLQVNEEAVPYAFIKKRLTNYEVTPPTNAWNNISNLLNGTSNFIPKKTKAPIISLSKWVAAAAILGAIIAGMWYNNTSTTLVTASIQQAIPPTGESVSPFQKEPREIVASVPSFQNNNINEPIQPRKVTNSKIKVAPIKTAKSEIDVNVAKIKITDDYLNNKVKNMVMNGYSAVISPAGIETNVSTKFSRILHSMDATNISNSETIIWQTRIEEWKNKLLHSGYTPGAGNFLDILELQNLLQEQ